MKVENLLHAEITSEFEKLKGMDVGSEEYKTTIDGLTKLVDRAIDIDKLNLESKSEELKQKQIEEEIKDLFVKNCLAAAGIVVPAVITIWGTIKSIKFEETGTITTIMGRGFINKLLPKK